MALGGRKSVRHVAPLQNFAVLRHGDAMGLVGEMSLCDTIPLQNFAVLRVMHYMGAQRCDGWASGGTLHTQTGTSLLDLRRLLHNE